MWIYNTLIFLLCKCFALQFKYVTSIISLYFQSIFFRMLIRVCWTLITVPHFLQFMMVTEVGVFKGTCLWSFNNNYLLMYKITRPFIRICKEYESNVFALIISSNTQTLTQNVFVPVQDNRGSFFFFFGCFPFCQNWLNGLAGPQMERVSYVKLGEMLMTKLNVGEGVGLARNCSLFSTSGAFHSNQLIRLPIFDKCLACTTVCAIALFTF